MCVSPSLLPNGVTVGCRRCWQCQDNYVSDWAGRNIAETMTARASYAVRFSYGRDPSGLADHLHSVMLFSSDMQKLLKRMRSKRYGYKVRYQIAGEYGSTFGRAHWHGIFHFYGEKLPDWEKHAALPDEYYEQKGGVHIPEWSYTDGAPIGHVHIKKAHYAHVRYALKYALKDQMDPYNSIKVLVSKYPPMGSEYLLQKARDIALAGLAPQDLTYRFPVTKYNGEHEIKRFMMRGKVSELYVQEYISEWQKLWPGQPMPESDLIGGYQRFGRIGRSEYLTPIDVEEREAQKKFEERLAKMERPRTLREYWRDKEFKGKLRDQMSLEEWERKYFGEEQQQRSRPRSGPGQYNDALQVAYVCWYHGITEQQFWASGWDQCQAYWRLAGPADNAAAWWYNGYNQSNGYIAEPD